MASGRVAARAEAGERAKVQFQHLVVSGGLVLECWSAAAQRLVDADVRAVGLLAGLARKVELTGLIAGRCRVHKERDKEPGFSHFSISISIYSIVTRA